MDEVDLELSRKHAKARRFDIEDDLLSRQAVYQTADYHDAKRYIDHTNEGFFQFSMPHKNGFEKYDIRSAGLRDIGVKLVRVDSKSDYIIRNTIDDDAILLHLVLRGSAEFRLGDMRIKAFPGQMVLLETKTQSSKCWNAPSQLLIIKLSRRLLVEVAKSDLTQNKAQPLDFGGLKVVDFKNVSTLWNFILTLCRDIGEEQPSFNGIAGEHAERMCYLLVIKTFSTAYESAWVDEKSTLSTPYYIRRVEKYIREFAKEPITMDKLIKVSGVSSRSVYNGFKRFRATTPMGYLKAVRLDLARTALMRKEEDKVKSVTEAALSVGYTNMSQFSRDYTMQFSEPPSKTLRGF